MTVLAAFLLAAAPTVPIAEVPARPRSGVSVTVRASAEILRVERVGGAPDPKGVERRDRQTPQGLLVEFM